MGETKHIMIVDDNASYRDILSINLKNEGFKITGTGDGLDALYKAKLEKPDLIILDIMLPNMDGHKVCRLIKMDTKLKEIPIIMISSRDTKEDADLAEKGGADAFLTKPTTVDDIISTINNIL